MNQINKRLKRIIFNKLYKDLSNAEIIYYDDSIWFIDRNEKYWYFEFEKNGKLWWRKLFFINFFTFFSMERSEFEPIISEWVEEVLNSKVVSTSRHTFHPLGRVEEVLNSKVVSTDFNLLTVNHLVEEVLNSKVVSTEIIRESIVPTVEEFFRLKIVSTGSPINVTNSVVEEVLNAKVVSTEDGDPLWDLMSEVVLNSNNEK